MKWRRNILNGISYFYYEDGNLESIIPYKNGIINGVVTHFYDNRKLKYKSLFKNGIEEKILEFYDKDGNKIKDNL
ncbi:toxin-antitoxin system YwqK family antitoxin [Fusobacterium animalis]|uniref:toxin-antitoxin system YwqK family antitoxin n=1 Tax=Fusobacterium animalis TaxID=76859 RepID=UPI0034DE0767